MTAASPGRDQQSEAVDTAPAKKKKDLPTAYQGLGYHELNAMLNLYDADGNIQFDADREAAHQYFLQHVNNNTVFFHDLEEKLDYLVKNQYYERETLDQYTMNFIRELYQRAYKKKFRFETFLGAFKFYTSYTLKTFDGKRFLERYEDRVCMVALHLARGNEDLASKLVDEIIEGRFQPGCGWGRAAVCGRSGGHRRPAENRPLAGWRPVSVLLRLRFALAG